MNPKNEEILQKLDSKPKKSKIEFVLKQKKPVKTGLSRVARERFELLSAIGGYESWKPVKGNGV